MKVQKCDQNAFKPISITITLESALEATAFYNIFNYSHNTALLGSHSSAAEEIRDIIGDQHEVYEDLLEGRLVGYNTTRKEYYK